MDQNKFNLSDEENLIWSLETEGFDDNFISVKAVRKFINNLKNDLVENDIYTADEIFRIINELAGEKLK